MGQSSVTPETIREIQRLRREGWSYKHIGRKLHVTDDMARKHAPFGETTKMDREPMKEFTDEMIEIGWQIVAKLKREGRWPSHLD